MRFINRQRGSFTLLWLVSFGCAANDSNARLAKAELGVVIVPIGCGARALTLDATGSLSNKECGLDGRWYWYSDGAGTSVSGLQPGVSPYRSGKGMCLTGHAIKDSSGQAWGAGVGILPRAPSGKIINPWNGAERGVIGFEVTLTGKLGLAELRIYADSSGTQAAGVGLPYVSLDGVRTHRILFSDFRVPPNVLPNGGEILDATQIRDIRFQVVGGEVDADFDFCISSIAPIVATSIDNLEDGNDAVSLTPTMNGTWYAYGDGTGMQSAASGPINTFDPNNGEHFAHTKGTGFTNWGAGIGLNFDWDTQAQHPAAYDASRFAGVWIRVRGSTAKGTLKVIPYTQEVATVENGGTCTENCIDPHYWKVPLTSRWEEHLLPFSYLFQNGTSPAKFDSSHLLALNFQACPGDFEIAIDDVAFYRSAAPKPRPDPGISVAIGATQTVLGAGHQGLYSYPDQAVLALDLLGTRRFFISAWPDGYHGYPSGNTDPKLGRQPTFALDATSFATLSSATPREVLSPGAGAAFDNGYAGISGLYRHSDGLLYAFYHAEDWLRADGTRTPPLPETAGTNVEVPGFYASVGAAASTNNGLSFTKLGPVVTSKLRKQWPTVGRPPSYDQGVGGPGTVAEQGGRYLYLYYTDNSRQDERTVQLSLARADLRQRDLGRSAFKKYYWGHFSQSGQAGAESPLPGESVYLTNPVRSYGHPSWSPYLNRYVMVLNLGTWNDALNDIDVAQSGIYVMFSEDGIYWSKPKPLIRDSIYFRPGRSFSYMGSLLFDDASGRSGWLVYSHTEHWGNPTGIMVANRIAFNLPFSMSQL